MRRVEREREARRSPPPSIYHHHPYYHPSPSSSYAPLHAPERYAADLYPSREPERSYAAYGGPPPPPPPPPPSVYHHRHPNHSASTVGYASPERAHPAFEPSPAHRAYSPPTVTAPRWSPSAPPPSSGVIRPLPVPMQPQHSPASHGNVSHSWREHEASRYADPAPPPPTPHEPARTPSAPSASSLAHAAPHPSSSYWTANTHEPHAPPTTYGATSAPPPPMPSGLAQPRFTPEAAPQAPRVDDHAAMYAATYGGAPPEMDQRRVTFGGGDA